MKFSRGAVMSHGCSRILVADHWSEAEDLIHCSGEELEKLAITQAGSQMNELSAGREKDDLFNVRGMMIARVAKLSSSLPVG